MDLLALALRSLLNRRFTVVLTIASIALSVTLLVGVERVRTETRSSFANTISGTDLIVGARGGATQLLLYSVFRIGNATNNIGWQSYLDIRARPRVSWTVPLVLGDSHRGFRVLGTSDEYFDRYRYAGGRSLGLAEGRRFDDVFDTVLGAQVANELGYGVGDAVVITHGAGDVTILDHADKPFTVVGVLSATGTPVDRTIHVSLEGYEAMHVDWRAGVPVPGLRVSADEAATMDLTPKTITAVLVGLDSRISTFREQRAINEYRAEPLLAIVPGVALHELWDMMAVAENALLAVSALVVLVGLSGMLTALLAGLNERRREMAILRSVGARPGQVFGLLLFESLLLTVAGIALGLVLLYTALIALRPLIETQFGLFIAIGPPSGREWMLLAAVLGAGAVTGALPAWRAYRLSLLDGMSIRI